MYNFYNNEFIIYSTSHHKITIFGSKVQYSVFLASNSCLTSEQQNYIKYLHSHN